MIDIGGSRQITQSALEVTRIAISYTLFPIRSRGFRNSADVTVRYSSRQLYLHTELLRLAPPAPYR